MAWTLPTPPRQSLESRVAYWQQMLQIPLDDPAAPTLREMAAHRLCELGALSATEAEQVMGTRDAGGL
jgi:hypothetical protein